MGVDISMYLVEKETGKIVKEDLFDGRNSEWFDNLQGKYINNEAYFFLPRHNGIPDCIKDGKIFEDYNKENCYYSFSYIDASQYLIWYTNKKPYKTAGWVRRYDAWLYDEKGVVPEEFYHYLPEDIPIEDMVFKEWHYNIPDDDIIRMLRKDYNDKLDNYYIVYYFDC